VSDHSLIVDYSGSSPVASIRQMLVNGYGIGDWSGSVGISSSSAHADSGLHHTLGYAEAAKLGVTTFAGQIGISSAVLVKYTYPGDSNLDGVVDLDNDFSLFVDGYSQQVSDPGSLNAGNLWQSGDYNYDGIIDLDNDFSIFVDAYNFGGPPIGQLQQSVVSDADLTFSQKQAMLSAVPEPGVGLIGLIGLAGYAGRDRRRNSAPLAR